jgi:hypothetical protein
MRTLNDLKSLTSKLATVAQEEYDAWAQDDEGFDEELGSGGICHLIAERMVEVLSEEDIEATTTHSEGVGENHVWVTAQTSDGVAMVDIPPGVYESGGGYVWRKKSGVTISSSDVLIDVIDRDPHKFAEYAGFDYEEMNP